jgi:hypothetical protein
MARPGQIKRVIVEIRGSRPAVIVRGALDPDPPAASAAAGDDGRQRRLPLRPAASPRLKPPRPLLPARR